VDYAQQQRNPGRHAVSIGVVIVLHLLLGWALVSGLAQRMVEVIKSPLETKIIEEVKPPPPPPPENLPPPPKFAPPPPSFVPPPEVQVNPPPTPAPTITTTTVAPPPAPVRVEAGPPAAAPTAAPAAPAAPVRVAPAVNFNSDCEKPAYPSAAARAEIQGEVRIRVAVGADGRVTGTEVVRSSGPSREHKMLDRAAEAVIRSSCKFRAGTVDGKPEALTTDVVYVWKLDN
jgi:protein TonB